LFELCNSIVASSLQQTTWLRKNYAVKLMPTSGTASSTPSTATTTTTSAVSGGGLLAIASANHVSGSALSTTSTVSDAQNSNVKALFIAVCLMENFV
jgi:hypothetical protein